MNTASVPLLARVAGLTPAVAAGIVRWRDEHGGFRSQRQLLDVAGIGAKTFEQGAGFLRISGGDDPLDVTGVHPESYPVVQRMLEHLQRPIGEVIWRRELLRQLQPERFTDQRFGAATVKDIVVELEKPGRDPRPGFQVARFDDGVRDLADLKPGQWLEGTISNVAPFGAFVDIGVLRR